MEERIAALEKEAILQFWNDILSVGFREINFGVGILDRVKQVFTEEEFNTLSANLTFTSENTAIYNEPVL